MRAAIAKLGHVLGTGGRYGPLLAVADRTNLCHLPYGPHCIRCGISAGQNSDEHVRVGVGYHAASHPPV